MMKPTGRMNRGSRLLSQGAACFLAYGLIRYAGQTAESACQGLSLCANTLIPALFPFFAASSLAVFTGLADSLGRWLENPMQKLFRLPGACASAFALGLAGGYPVGAKTALSLYQQGLCEKKEAQRLLAFCNNCGPAFILGAAGGAVFRSPAAGGLLYLCHVLASLLTGLLFRFSGSGQQNKGPSRPAPRQEIPFSAALAESVRSAASSTLNVCAFVVFFTVFLRLLKLTGLLAILTRLLASLGVPAALTGPLAAGCFEMSGGVAALGGAAAPLRLRLTVAAFLLAWGGLSVHCQTLSLLSDSGLSVRPYFAGKFAHGLLAAGLTWLAAPFLPLAQAAGSIPLLAGQASLPFSPAVGAVCAALLALWLFCRQGKQKKIASAPASRYNKG